MGVFMKGLMEVKVRHPGNNRTRKNNNEEHLDTEGDGGQLNDED